MEARAGRAGAVGALATADLVESDLLTAQVGETAPTGEVASMVRKAGAEESLSCTILQPRATWV